jgi:hypothetical protein
VETQPPVDGDGGASDAALEPAPLEPTPDAPTIREPAATAETVRMRDGTDDGVTAETERLTGAATAETERLTGAAAVPGPGVSDPSPAPPPPERTGRRRAGVVAALALVVALVVAATLLWTSLQPDTAPDAGTATDPTPSQTPVDTEQSPTPTAGEPPAEESAPEEQQSAPPAATPEQRAAEAISGYYALLPGDLDTAWPLMTADYQENHAGGRGGYEAFWAGIAGVEVADVVATGPDQVQATLTYSYQDGSVVQEVTAYRLVDEGGVLKIAASEVLSSADL